MSDSRSSAHRRGLVLLASDRQVTDVLDTLNNYEREQIERIVADAYAAGERDADDRSARFVARCVAALVGLPMGADGISARATLGRLRSLFPSRG